MVINLQYIPRRHQELAGEFLRTHNKAALFLDMGLGKTVITLTRIAQLIDDFAIDKALVIAPLNVARFTWAREGQKWDHTKHLRVSEILGSAAERRAALAKSADIYVINRENVQWLVEELNGKWPFQMTVIDELSSFKSSSSKRWRMLKRVIGCSDYVIALTGTPASNGYLDLWPEIYLVDKGERLGRTLGEYRGRYFTPGAHKGYVVYEWRMKAGAKAEIDRKLSDICLSMSKEDWLEMPPILYSEIWTRMDTKARSLYETIKRDKILPLIDGKVTADMSKMTSAIVGSMAATLSGKLLQMANGAVYDDGGEVVRIHDAKLDALEEAIEAANGQSVLVFYQYKHDAARIKERLPQAQELDQHSIEAWCRGEVPVLLCHPASAGHGLNLQSGGHIIIWFGLPWSLELYQQANARLYRQGQEQSVIVHHILCEDTLDDKVMSVLRGKDNTQKALLDALKQYIGGDTDGSDERIP